MQSSELCVNVEVAVLSSLPLIVLMISVDVKRHLKKKNNKDSGSIASVEMLWFGFTVT